MPRFPRGRGPLVSVLLPTRGRPQWLLESVDSLFSLAFDQTRLELVIKADTDDEPTLDNAARIQSILRSRCTVIASPRGNGYLDMPRWAMDMTAAATGDWFLLWNDDARMLTHGWDEIIHRVGIQSFWHQCPDIALLAADTEGKPLATEFIFVRRKVIELLGHWALSPHCDNWLWTVCNNVGSALRPPIHVRHTHDANKDDVRAELLHRMRGVEFNSVPMIERRLKDSRVLLDYIESYRHQQRN